MTVVCYCLWPKGTILVLEFSRWQHCVLVSKEWAPIDLKATCSGKDNLSHKGSGMTIWGRQSRHEIQIACVLRHLVVRRGIRWYFIWLPALTFIKNSTGHVLFLDIGPAHTWIKKPISRFRKHSLLSILPNIIEGWIEYSEGDRIPTVYLHS